jgi:hypothetical protein
MLHNKIRLTALAGCAVGVLVVAGCGAREPVEAPPPASGYGSAKTPDLMGAPPPQAAPADGLLGGPSGPTPATAPIPVTTSADPNLTTWRRADGSLVTAMAPIANPKPRTIRYTPRPKPAPTHRAHVAPVAHAAAKPVVAVKPAPVAAPRPVAKPAPKPIAVAPAPAPLKPVVAPKPVPVIAKAPVIAPVAPAPIKAEPVKPLTKLQKLQAATAPEATKDAALASAESLTQGKEGQVTLSLPATLGDLIKKEAAKLGLTKAAKKTSAYADLQGEGYEITPNGRQTAVVKAGEPTNFAWNVKPTPAAKGQLKTEFGVELGGAKPAQGFSLGSIVKQVVPIQQAVEEKAKGLKMPGLGRFETIDLPGVGKVPGKSLLGGLLVLLAALILVVIARNASAAKSRAERQRKFRTLTDYGRNEMDFDAPKSAEVNYVNPMVAAAGGAFAGAAAASAVNHAPVEHSPFETSANAFPAGAQGAFIAPIAAETQSVSGHDHGDTAAADHGHVEDHGHDDPGHVEPHHDAHAAPEPDDHHVAPAAGAEALPVSGHEHVDAHAADDHGQAAEAHAPEAHAPEAAVEAGHHDEHPATAGHDAHVEPVEHKELEHTH